MKEDTVGEISKWGDPHENSASIKMFGENLATSKMSLLSSDNTPLEQITAKLEDILSKLDLTESESKVVKSDFKQMLESFTSTQNIKEALNKYV